MTRLRQGASPGVVRHDDRKKGRVRAVRADLVWLDGTRGVATLTIDGNAPTVLMVDGDPFVRSDIRRRRDRPGEQPQYFQGEALPRRCGPAGGRVMVGLIRHRSPNAADVSRQQLKRYREAITLWLHKRDTWEISQELNLPESLVAGWVANFRELVRAR
ncbi:hypothetical protein [Bradyrhizobium tunisiense]|uniref:hypothetical protein n=1 Tax=Bradyrhizobium tunisiense TaxID=3278709 RepID=UPI0035DCF60E